ncbi:MAG: ATP-binding protein, partial [Prevotella sp.]|nr:ATP-binding protein [Prevotella sp.]
MNKIENPFLVYGYEGPTYFCDRQKETDDVISALTNGCNLTLMSPRRYGKTGLIHNVFHRLKEQDKNISCFYVDIYATNTLSDFVRVLGKSVVGKLDTPLQKAEGLISKFFRNSQ